MTEINMRCPVCQSETFKPVNQIFDDRYGEPNYYQLACCSVCGHLATAPRLKENDLPALYETYYPRKNISPDEIIREAARSNRAFSRLHRWWTGTDNQGHYSVRKGEAMLDVGCGRGVSLLEAKAMGAKAFGIEADPNVKAIAEILGLSIHLGSLTDRPFPEQTFDLIVMNQVIEHLPEPDLALLALREMLTPNGRIILAFPNKASLWRHISGNSWINWHVPYHLHHFDFKRFEQMIRHCRLKIVRSRTVTPNVWTLLQLRAFNYKAKFGKSSPIWSVTGHSDAVSSENHKLAPLRMMLRAGVLTILALINRVVDALGFGDSLLIELHSDE